MRKNLWVVGLILSWAVAFAQNADQTARFEVASVKFRPQGAEPGHTGNISPIRNFTGLLTYRDVTLKAVVMRAYSLADYSKMIVPEWMEGNRYDIMARAPAGARAEQVPAMLRNLLAERFKMRAHWETREMATYTLVVRKGGPKLTLAKTNPPEGQESGTFTANFSSPMRFSYKSTTMDVFARSLSQLVHQPVLNETGLDGYFDIDVAASVDSMPGLNLPELSHATEATDPSYQSIFDAVKTLGLTLEPRKSPVRLLIVDSAEKMPTAN